ncbi:ACP phosphodiesterase [Haloferula sargassicola]|uniref:Acyl carrier protein phosphodiesterase n=1 Tax=Haloferula sargassicola TaxID=490096 RepID=A0ABP9UNS0_9BACT
MNYLAHLFLAEDHAASRIGNLLGDFITGRPEEIDLPDAVVAGIVRHRAIDRFTDDHPVVVRTRGLFTGPRRRFANAILDICFDHFLANGWEKLHSTPLRVFLDRFYGELRTHRDWLPEEISRNLDARIEDDWLGHYDTEAGLQEVFDRVAHHRPACAAVATAMEDFVVQREEIKAAFESFLPDLSAHLVRLGAELGRRASTAGQEG